MRIIRKKVAEIEFSLFSPEQIKKISVAKIVTPELYDIDGYPVDGGLMDLRMGAIDPGVRCRTCGGRLKECLGHPGRIDLARPVIHLKYIPLIEMGMRCFCSECGKLKLSEKDLNKYSPSERVKKAKDVKKCPYKFLEPFHDRVNESDQIMVLYFFVFRGDYKNFLGYFHLACRFIRSSRCHSKLFFCPKGGELHLHPHSLD